MTRSGRLAILLGLASLFATAADESARASHAPITTTADSTTPGSLRAALTAATAGETVLVPAGTYRLSPALGELTVDAAVIIDGTSAATTVIDAQGASRVLRFTLPAVPGTFATVRDLTITGGAAAGGNSEGGGGILNDSTGGGLIVLNSSIRGNRAGGLTDQPVEHGGGGIQNKGPGGLLLVNSTVSGNSVDHNSGGGSASGGGGIHNVAGPLTVLGSTVSGNLLTGVGTSTEIGGGGIHSRGSTTVIRNSTISGNVAIVPAAPPGSVNGGGGIFTGAAGIANELRNVTVFGNSTTGAGGGLLASSATATTTALRNSILTSNSPANCAEDAPADIVTGGANMESPGNTCGLAAADFPATDPGLGPLAANGGPTRTHALPPGSPAIDRVSVRTCAPSGPDQRGVSRPKGALCDIGAYEFDGLSSAGAASCALGGTVPVSLTPPPGATAVAVRFRVDGGSEGRAAASGYPPGAAIPVPEGTHALEYWAELSDGTQEAGHHVVPVVRPACPATAGPSPPVLGRTFNVEPLSGRVFVSLPRGASLAARGGARAAASVPGLKGRRFVALKEARQIPIGSFLDTRRGRVRLTTARDATSRRLQAGVFYSGVFQVLQSRRRKSRGLTELRLKGASFKRCALRRRARHAQAGWKVGAAVVHAARRLSRRRIRRLRANARGRFRTRGRYSSATVRGTFWSTTDRCDGTLTRVARGSVTVRDFRRHKNIVVRRGKTYLAKARR